MSHPALKANKKIKINKNKNKKKILIFQKKNFQKFSENFPKIFADFPDLKPQGMPFLLHEGVYLAVFYAAPALANT